MVCSLTLCLFYVSALHDSNHVSSLTDLQINDDSLLDGSIVQGIPEESAITVSETPYEPLDSPLREELPPLPPTMSGTSPPVMVMDDMANKDLDTQIQELQNELDRCRQESSNHVGAAPPGEHQDVQVADISKAKPDPHLENNMPPANTVDKSSTKQKGTSYMCILFISTVFVFITMVIFGLLILESDLQMPVLTDIRQLPEVQDFKDTHYSPLKDSMAQKVGGWFKT